MLLLYSSACFFSVPSSKECLVSSSGNDNTENGLSGAKADNKDKPKAWETSTSVTVYMSMLTWHALIYELFYPPSGKYNTHMCTLKAVSVMWRQLPTFETLLKQKNGANFSHNRLKFGNMRKNVWFECVPLRAAPARHTDRARNVERHTTRRHCVDPDSSSFSCLSCVTQPCNPGFCCVSFCAECLASVFVFYMSLNISGYQALLHSST